VTELEIGGKKGEEEKEDWKVAFWNVAGLENKD